jgi:hypothetical protein
MLKLVAAVALFAGFCWFGTQVQLGSHTLFGHLHAIAGTQESQDLFDGTKESAKPLVDDVRRRIAGAPDPGEIAKTKVQEKVAEKLAEKAADKAAEKLADKSPERGDKAAAKTDGKSEPKSQAKVELPKDRAKGHDKDEEITTSERRRLRRLISSAEGASAPR